MLKNNKVYFQYISRYPHSGKYIIYGLRFITKIIENNGEQCYNDPVKTIFLTFFL